MTTAIDRFYNANFIEQLIIDDQKTGEKNRYIVSVKSGSELTAEHLEYSMAEWKLTLNDDEQLDIMSTHEEKFYNCHSAYDARGGECRHGKANAIYGIIFVFDLNEMKYIGQGYLLKVLNARNEESLIFEGVQTDHQDRSLTLAKVLLETMTGETWQLAKRSLGDRGWYHHTWLGAEHGSNYVQLKKYDYHDITLDHPGHSVELKKAFADLSDFDYYSNMEGGIDDPEDEPRYHTCEVCDDEYQEGWMIDGYFICNGCAVERADEDLPYYVRDVDYDDYISTEMDGSWIGN